MSALSTLWLLFLVLRFQHAKKGLYSRLWFYSVKKGGKIGENQLAVNDISPTCVDQPWNRLTVLNSPETQNVLGVAGSVAAQK